MPPSLKLITHKHLLLPIKRNYKQLTAGLLLVSLILGIIFLRDPNAVSASEYSFFQTSWGGGASTTASAVYPADMSSWNKYYSRDNINTANGLSLGLDSASSTFNTASDFSAGSTTASTTILNGALQLAYVTTMFGNGADGSITVSSSKNINTDAIAAGRTCADGKAYNISSLTATSATIVATTTLAQCIRPGDRVILLNLQANGANLGNVGNYEFLNVLSTSTNTINFTANKTKYYGNGTSSDDTNIGTLTTNQRVIIQRVPQYADVTIQSGGTLTASAWNGAQGGVLAFRANGTVNVQSGGNITMSAKGYRSASGKQGESYNEVGVNSMAANLGGGGRRASNPIACIPESGSGGGYGSVGATSSPTYGGETYGSSDLSKLFMGSAAGSLGAGGSNGAGIIYIDTLNITASSSITNNGGNSGGSGGSLYLRGANLSLGPSQLTAVGGDSVDYGWGDHEDCGGAYWLGGISDGGVGRIHLKSDSITGTTSPSSATSSLDAIYQTSGIFTSEILDTNHAFASSSLNWSATVPASTTLTMKVRGASASSSVSSKSWCTVTSGQNIFDACSTGAVDSQSRYYQYQATLGTASTTLTPTISSVAVTTEFTASRFQDGTTASTTIESYAVNLATSSPSVYWSSGAFTSAILDTGLSRLAVTIGWSATTSASTTLAMKVRGATATSSIDGKSWCSVYNGQNIMNYCDAGSVDPTSRYFQYEATLVTTDTAVTPALNDVDISFGSYPPTLETLISSPFDTTVSYNAISALSWTEDIILPTSTSVMISVRTATTSALLASSTWSDFTSTSTGCAKVGATTTCPASAIPSNIKDGDDDRWFQYKVSLMSIDGLYTPTVNNINVSYLFNTRPETSITNSVSQGTDGKISVDYQIRDQDTENDTPSSTLFVSLEYCTATCTSTPVWATASSPALSGQFATTTASTTAWLSYSLTWDPEIDYPDQTDANFKVRIKVDDQTPGPNTAYAVSNSFALNTNVPSAPSISATDGTYIDRVAMSWASSTGAGAIAYEIYRDGVSIGTTSNLSMNDTGAGLPTIVPGTVSASDFATQTTIILNIAGSAISPGATHSYTATAHNHFGTSSISSANTGYRTGSSSDLTYQWQRSSGNSDSNFSNISGATANPYTDNPLPSNTHYYYQVILSASSLVSATAVSDRGSSALDLGGQSIRIKGNVRLKNGLRLK